MTSLKRQLESLSSPASALLVPDRRKRSILFTQAEASQFQQDKFYAIGIEGLKELVSICPSLFAKFVHSPLFNESSLKISRAVLTPEDNQQLNIQIGDFLITLSPYMLFKAALKCLEWLQYRFVIGTFNIGEILECILPYYDTRAFVSVSQILEIKRYQKQAEWSWLVHFIESGTIVRRASLYANVNTNFINWLFATLDKFLIIHADHQHNLRVYMSFFMSTIAGILSSLFIDVTSRQSRNFGLTRSIVSTLWDYSIQFTNCISGTNLENNFEFNSMVYVVISILALLVRDKPELIAYCEKSISQVSSALLLKTNQPNLKEKSYLLGNLLSSMCSLNWSLYLPGKSSAVKILNQVSSYSHQWDFWHLLCQIMNNFTAARVVGKPLSPKKVFEIIDSFHLTTYQRSEILKRIYMNYQKNQECKIVQKWKNIFLKKFDRKYPTEFELILRLKGHKPYKDFKKFKRIQRTQLGLVGNKKKKVKSPIVKAVNFCSPFRDRISDLDEIFARIEKFNIRQFKVEFPIKKEDFNTCRELSKRKNNLCLELLLTTFMKIGQKYTTTTTTTTTTENNNKIEELEIEQIGEKINGQVTDFKKLKDLKNDEDFFKIFKFALVKCEDNENRGLVSKFLELILKSRFASQGEIIQFFNKILMGFCKEQQDSTASSSSNDLEFYIIRILQFLASLPYNSSRFKNKVLGKKCVVLVEKIIIETPVVVPVVPVVNQRVTRASVRLQLANNNDNNQIDKIKNKKEEIKEPQEIKITIKNIENDNENNNDNNDKKNKDQDKLYQDILNTLIFLLLPQKSARIRHWTLAVLEQVKNEFEPDFTLFVQEFIDAKQEILADSGQSIIVGSTALGKNIFKKNVLPRLIGLIKDDLTEEMIKIGMIDLIQQCGDNNVFGQLKPLVKKLLSSNPGSKVLHGLLHCYDNDLGSIDLIEPCLGHQETSKILLQRITRENFDKYDKSVRHRLFNMMVSYTISLKIPQIIVNIQRCVRKWNLDSDIIITELEKCVQLQRTSSGQEINNVKIKKRVKNTQIVQGKVQKSIKSNSKLEDSPSWTSKTESVLEFVQSNKRIKNKTRLISSLFKLLKVCINLEEQSPVEYLKQLILSTLSYCCRDVDEKNKDNDTGLDQAEDWVHFNVETIIDCLRCSRNPQTHHHALILLNYAAKRYPEQVLHGVMSLFTFMGNSILRQDDSYSTQLIQQTVATIIPTLIQITGSKRQFSKSLISSGIYRVFISAVLDIPAQRRQPVFYSLIDTMDPEESMWQFCIILVDNALIRDKKKSNVSNDLELGTNIIWSFGPEIIVKTLENVYDYLSSIQIYEKNYADNFSKYQMAQSAFSKSIIDLSKKTPRDVQIIIFYTLGLVSNVCSKFGDLEVKVSYDTLLEKCLSYMRLASIVNEEKLFRMIVQRNLEIVEKINSFLDPSELITVVSAILSGELFTVKKKILDILNQRILHKAEWFGNLNVLLPLIGPLITIINIEPADDESITLIQTAFHSLKLISRLLAQLYPEEFVPVFELSFKSASHKNKLLRASALLTMAELFCLKSLILPRLDDLAKVLINSFKACSKWVKKLLNESEISVEEFGRTGNLLSLSLITCLNKLAEQLGPFMGQKLLEKSLISIVSLQKQYHMENDKVENRKKAFDSRLKILLKTLASKIPLRNLLEPIKSAYKNVLENNAPYSTLLITLLQDCLMTLPKSEFSSLNQLVCDLFLQDFLPFRDLNSTLEYTTTEDSVNCIENGILNCLVSIIVKMSESQFKPFYHKVFDWAGDNDCRLITFYRLSTAAGLKLKSLFVTFVGHSVGAGSGLLDKRTPELTKAILQFYYQIFSNDREGFVSVERFNVLVQPLVDLLDSEFLINEKIPIEDLSSTLVQLALATNDLNRWQHLINLISYKSRSSESKVRMFVLRIVEDAATALDKDFLPLLPPAVPFLAELLNDDDTVIENRAQTFLLRLENIVGEPLQSYFTT